MTWSYGVSAAAIVSACLMTGNVAGAADSLQSELEASGFELVHERYVDNNWELFSTSADGKSSRNLTNTPDVHELYPQVSPNGKWICFIVDEGKGRNTKRSVWVMNAVSGDRKLVSEYARQPFWHPNSRTLGYLPQEYKKFNIVDYFSKGMVYYDVESGESRPHPNSARLHHLYNPSFSADGRWIASTVHAGMGFSHAILLIEAEGDRILNLEIRGCRPCLSPDGSRIAWGPGDHELRVAELDLSAETPKVGKTLLSVKDASNKIYHVDFSPDGNYISFSRGPNGKGDINKPGTHEAACEMVGVFARDWDLVVTSATPRDSLDLNSGRQNEFRTITSGGASNKESDWWKPSGGTSK